MYRLLIVDDEYHVVDWLTDLFANQKNPEFEIYKAYLAKDALAILNRVKIDVVLSDIKMPGMDGFELVDHIRSNWPEARILFLTGYNDFEYAYKAGKYGNISYLLKTEDDDVILNEVNKAVKSLEKERKELKLMADYATMQELVDWQMKKNILLEKLEKESDEAVTEDVTNMITFCFIEKFAIMNIHIEKPEQQYLEHEKDVLRLQKLLERMLAHKGTGLLINTSQSECLWIVQGDTSLILFLKEMLEEFSEICLKHLGYLAFFSLYDRTVLFREIKSKYEILLLSARNSSEIQSDYGGRLVGKEEEKRIKESCKEDFNNAAAGKIVEQMYQCLDTGKETEFFERMDKLSLGIEKIAVKHDYSVITVFQMISAMYLQYISSKDMVEKLAFRIGLNGLFQVSVFDNWTSAFSYLEQIGRILFEERKQEQNSKNDAFTQRIKEYIRSHLSGDLSLTAIAHYMNYNPSYISRLFKKTCGVNLFEYINNERMEYAADCLIKQDDSIQQIAKKVGFESSQYFFTAFKKQYGLTPGEYRRINSKEVNGTE